MDVLIWKESAAEVVQQDILRLHPQVFEHLQDGGHHRGRSAEVVFAVFWIGMVFEVVIEHYLVDESRVALPVDGDSGHPLLIN